MDDKAPHGKFCRDCGEVRPVSEFIKDNRRRDGLSFYCKTHARRRLLRSKDARLGRPKARHPREVAVPTGHKWCPDCKQVKPVDDFVRNAGHSSGRGPYCKPCHNVRGKASKERVGGARNYHLKRRYGISAEEADAMREEQAGLCAICRTAPATQVDHDHVTGAVRALLCFNCNGGLGQFRDDPAVLRAAAAYVEEHRRRQSRGRSRPLAARRPEAVSRPVPPPVGSGRRPVIRLTALCSRGRATLAAREADG
jgi:hypothetical protein